MKRFALILVLLLLSAAGLSAAGTDTYPHKSLTDPSVYIPLREEMTRLEMRFVDIEVLAAASALDRKAIRDAIGKMEASAKKIRQVNRNREMDEPLQTLFGQLSALRKNATAGDAAAIQSHLDRLYQTCFRCHETHAPRMR